MRSVVFFLPSVAVGVAPDPDDVIIGGSTGSNRSRSCTFSFARRCPVLMAVMCAVAVSVDVTVAVSVDVTVAVSVDITPTVLSSLLSWLCSSFAGDVANSVSLLLSGVPQVRGVLADVVLLAGLVAALVTWSISRLSGLAWGSASRDIVASRTMLTAFTGHITVPSRWGVSFVVGISPG